MTRRMHLVSFQINSPINHTVNSWAHPQDNRLEALGSFAIWQDLARTLERGCFDALFFADTPGVFDRYLDRADEAVRHGVCWPTHDPMALLPAMAAATTHLGFAVTMSVSTVQPYALVRSLCTFDYLSGGRAGWNVVTGHLRGEHRAMGQDQVAHDDRYDRADEFMQVCRKLWSGIAPDALVCDRATGIYADPAKVAMIRHEGKYYRTHTVPPVLPSAQGHPVIFQAGSSGRGQKFALDNAEVTFSIQPHLGGMKRYMAQVAAAAAEAGRQGPMRVSFGLQPVIGGTEAEAQRLYRDLMEAIPIDGALARLSGSLGVDFSTFDLDKPLEEVATDASQGLMKAMTAMVGGEARMTLRELAMRWGMAVGIMPVIGTPEQVAARMEEIWRETGCFGFNITPTVNNSSTTDFVDQVVPLLQARGVYRREYAATTLRGNLLEDEA
ncbi:NtaA/DmoA family FMN-dependent monooxygenase [Gemmobacter sp.]|uniref:NtaA/DmoA family FMN-dependent monooxygenase n=1 Tax=Gemmobacter sp. TaxID=1898957 RepID=UPI002AFEB4C9|nr:NtaA/DmoA family FMN-dependent monooxygenase [Gemmobacter sp.]